MSSLSLLETDLNVMTVDVIPVIVNIVVKVLLINLTDEEMSEMSSKEYPVRKKKNQGKDGGKLPPLATKIMANAIS